MLPYLYRLTFCADPVGITLIPASTRAHSPVILDLTFSIGATSEGGTRILAAFLDACKVQGAFRVSCALRSWSWK